jgi:hypothetical protein
VSLSPTCLQTLTDEYNARGREIEHLLNLLAYHSMALDAAMKQIDGDTNQSLWGVHEVEVVAKLCGGGE